MEYHVPVLSLEILDLLQIKSKNTYIDATLGHGGHSLEILKKGGTVYGIDQDPFNLQTATKRIEDEGLKNNFFPIHSNFSDLKIVVKNNNIENINGIIFDLGLSQNQIKSQGRGFSFNDQSSLDMRLDPENQTQTAENIINTASSEELYEIFTKYSQEIYSKPIINKIIRERQKSPIKTATRLAEIIRDSYQKLNKKTKIDPSTKIFLALRIAVNEELINLKSTLNQTLEILKPGAIVCIITFHSTEDRLVKQFINEKQIKNLITSFKPVKPSYQEIRTNPLSRSAILRSYKIN